MALIVLIRINKRFKALKSLTDMILFCQRIELTSGAASLHLLPFSTPCVEQAFPGRKGRGSQ
jgi:hypothetical protein